MILTISFIVACWLTAVAAFSFRQLIAGENHNVYFCLILFWLFYGIPLFLDIFIGPAPTLGRNMAMASNDPGVTAIYLSTIALSPILLFIFGCKTALMSIRHLFSTFTLPTARPQPVIQLVSGHPPTSLTLLGMVTALILPPIAVLFAPDPSIYFKYGSMTDMAYRPSSVIFYHAMVNLLCALTTISAALIARNAKHVWRAIALTAPWVVLATFIQGKRLIPVLYVLLLAQCLHDRGLLRGLRLVIFSICGAIAVITFSYSYQANVRNIAIKNNDNLEYYRDIRMDFGRDHDLRTAIYAELSNQRILPYRCETILYYGTIFIPRSLWPEKPWPYAPQLTEFSIGARPHSLTWGFTTNILDECVANFGWWGLAFGPLLLGAICRLSDRNRTPMLRILSVIVCVLFISVQLSAFSVIFFFWFMGTLASLKSNFFTLSRAIYKNDSA